MPTCDLMLKSLFSPSMSAFHSLLFNELCLNNKLVGLNSEGSINEFKIYQERGRKHLELTITPNDSLQLEIQESISEFNYSKWVAAPDFPLILDFEMLLRSLPEWMLQYSTAKIGCVQRVAMTMKVDCSQSQFKAFVGEVSSVLADVQCKSLEKFFFPSAYSFLITDGNLSRSSEASVLWKERSTIPPTRKVLCVKFLPPNFEKFSIQDLERLKDDEKWLSDTHITLGLQHCFRDCASREVWGNLRIKLLDTLFWQKLSEEPGDFHERYRTKLNLLECDFVVMPMFDEEHWRLGIIEKPGEFMERKTEFHILDSLASGPLPTKEEKQLQMILLQYFKDESYEKDRITVNLPKVPRQDNTKDCGCFIIYFAKKFFNNPEATVALLKTRFKTKSESIVAWGLKDRDLTFVRREIKALLFKYINQGEAVVEYK